MPELKYMALLSTTVPIENSKKTKGDPWKLNFFAVTVTAHTSFRPLSDAEGHRPAKPTIRTFLIDTAVDNRVKYTLLVGALAFFSSKKSKVEIAKPTHTFCLDCIRAHALQSVTEGLISPTAYGIRCMAPACEKTILFGWLEFLISYVQSNFVFCMFKVLKF